MLGIFWVAAGLGLLWWLPVELTMKGLIWLFGAGVWFFAAKGRVPRDWQRPIWAVGGLAFFCGSLALSKISSPLGSDYAVGFVFAAWMAVLAGPWPGGLAFLCPIGRYFSEISYTLYVTHFPLLFLFSATILKGRQYGPEAAGFAWFAALLAVCLAAASFLWWIFERRTDRVRDVLGRILLRNLGNAPNAASSAQ